MSKCADFFILVAAAAVLAAGCGSPAAGPGGPGGNGGGGSGAGGSTDVDAAPRGGSGGSRLDAGQDATVVLSDAPVSVDQMPDAGPDFCDSYAAQACQRLVACSQPYVTAVYGDMTTCQDRVRLLCVTEAVLPGTGLNRATMAACQAALPGASCDDLFARAVTACQMKGTLATGAACGSGSQCQSGFCRTPETSFCGKCAARAAEGAPCDTSESCEFPLLCSETGHCVKASGEGELCNESKPCKGGLLFCAADNTCKRASGEGKACNRAGAAPLQPCDIGYSCRPSASGICRAIRFSEVGQACGLPTSSTATVVLCKASGSCIQDVCRAAGKDGEPCTIAPLGDSGGCMTPALCLEGLCKLPAPASCM